MDLRSSIVTAVAFPPEGGLAMAKSAAEEVSPEELVRHLDLFQMIAAKLDQRFKNQGEISKAVNWAKGKVNGTLQWLEGRFGQPMLKKVGGVYHLSEGGESLLERAGELFRQLDELSVYSLNPPPEEVIIGADSDYVRVCLPAVVEQFTKAVRSEHARVNLRFVEDDSETLLHLLEQDRVQIALTPYTVSKPGKFKRYPLPFEVEYRLVARRDRLPERILARPTKEPVRLWQLGELVLCLVAFDERKLRPHGLPPSRGGDRVFVKEYASVVPLIRTGAVDAGIVATVGDTVGQFEGIDTREFVLREISLEHSKGRRFSAWVKRGRELSRHAQRFLALLRGEKLKLV